MLENAKGFACQHIFLNNVHHAMGGFGLALVLQHYLASDPFLPVVVGWILIGFTAIMHIYTLTRKDYRGFGEV